MRRLLETLILLSFLVFCAGVTAQTSIPPGPLPSGTPASQDIKAALDSIISRLEKQEKDLYEFRIQGYAAAAAILGVATLAGLLQLVSTNKARDRELIIEQLLNVYKIGEEASQKRAAELHNVMLREGETTLKLVNDTLSLASQASKRAVEAVERKLSSQLYQLDDEARAFFRDYNGGFSRDLLTQRTDVDRIRQFYDTLESVKTGNNTLEKEIPLTNFSYLVQAIKHYLDQEYRFAIASFYEVFENAKDDLELKIQTGYWIAWSHNNVAQYEPATKILRQIEPAVLDERRYEFRRLLIETRFFNGEDPTTLQDDIRKIQDDATAGKVDTALLERVKITQGNFLYNIAQECKRNRQGAEAERNLQEAISLYRTISPGNILARRDLALAMYALGDRGSEVMSIFADEVRPHALEEQSRVEPRSKALAHTVALMCYMILKDIDIWKDKTEPTLRATVSYIQQVVHPDVTVFSPMQRKNLLRKELIADISQLMKQGIFTL